MNNIISISDFRNNISDYISRVTYKKESFLLKKGKSIVAEIISFDKRKEAVSQDKIKKFAGIWTEKDAENIKKYAKKLRKEAKLIRPI